MIEVLLIFFLALGGGIYALNETGAAYAGAEIFLLVFFLGVALKLAYPCGMRGGAR